MAIGFDGIAWFAQYFEEIRNDRSIATIRDHGFAIAIWGDSGLKAQPCLAGEKRSGKQ
jgi:hypothetical protein